MCASLETFSRTALFCTWTLVGRLAASQMVRLAAKALCISRGVALVSGRLPIPKSAGMKGRSKALASISERCGCQHILSFAALHSFHFVYTELTYPLPNMKLAAIVSLSTLAASLVVADCESEGRQFQRGD